MGDEVAVLSPADTAALLAPPDASEELALGPRPILATELHNDIGLDEAGVDRLVSDLGALRALTVAVVTEPVGLHLERLARAYDVVLAAPEIGSLTAVPVEDPAPALASLAAGVAANPQAAVAMAQLLRLACWDDVAAGLVAESLTYSTLQSGPEHRRWLSDRGPATVPPDPGDPVLVRRIGSRLDVVLDRPHRANAVTAAVRDALVEAFRLASLDPTLDGIVLTGAGASFCSGGDLAEFGTTPDPATGHAVRTLRSPAWWLHRIGRRVRVHLHGACIGAGIELPSFAGTVLAAPDTRIRLPEVAMGLVPGAGGTVGITRRIGPSRTTYLAVTGAQLDAHEALAWGLVDRIVDRPTT